MKYLFCIFCLSVAFIFVPQPIVLADPPMFLNRVEGQIFNEERRPIGDMYVELLNEVGSPLTTQKSSPSGRFTFTGLSIGNFRLRVLPSGKNFLEQSKDIRFDASLRGATDDVQFVEFYLRADKRFMDTSNERYPEAIFVQDIPDDARKLFKSGIDSLSKNNDQGLADLERAIEISPNYFDALSRLGKEYILRKNYEKAYPYLLRAIDQNARSYSSYYALGFAFYQLKQIPAAVKAAQACTVIRGDSVEAHVLYGTLLRISGAFDQAEKELKKALSIAKSPNAEAHWQLALLFNRLNRNAEAADQLELYLKFAPPEDAGKKEIKDLVAKLRAAKQT